MRFANHKAGAQRRVLIAAPLTTNPYITLLSEALQQAGVQTTVLGRRRALPLLESAWATGPFDIVHLQWMHGYLISLKRPQRILALFLTARFYLQLVYLTASGAQVVWTIHNIANHEKVLTQWEQWHYRTLAKRAKRLIVHCDSAARLVADAYRVPLDKIRTVPMGDYGEWYTQQGLVAEDRCEARAQLGLSQDAFVLLFFGVVRFYKGVSELIDSFAKIPGDHLFLLIAGTANEPVHDAALRDLANQDARIRLDNRFIEDPLLLRYISACDAVVLPYRDVLTSSSINLASTQGRCSIVPRLGCMQEFGDGAAITYDAGDDNGLHAALDAAVALGQAGLDEIGRQAQARVRAVSWAKVAQQTIQVYNECL